MTPLLPRTSSWNEQRLQLQALLLQTTESKPDAHRAGGYGKEPLRLSTPA